MAKKEITKQQEAMIRVNQAGEYGAKQIYKGQLAVLGNTDEGPILRHMQEQELEHLQAYNRLAVQHSVRPTVLQPLWHVAGYVLGATTALMGKKAAHACTIAVEETIEEHYLQQMEELSSDTNKSAIQSELHRTIHKCYQEEIEHKHISEEHGGREALAYEHLSKAIKGVSKLAIWLSSKI